MSQDAEIFARTESGYEFVNEDAILTPVQADRFLKRLHNEVGRSQLDLRKTRRTELDAYKAYIIARKPYELDPECPEVGRGVGRVTMETQELWFEARVHDEYWAWKNAVLARRDAEGYMWQVKQQAKLVQSINSNTRTYFDTDRGGR